MVGESMSVVTDIARYAGDAFVVCCIVWAILFVLPLFIDFEKGNK